MSSHSCLVLLPPALPAVRAACIVAKLTHILVALCVLGGGVGGAARRNPYDVTAFKGLSLCTGRL